MKISYGYSETAVFTNCTLTVSPTLPHFQFLIHVQSTGPGVKEYTVMG